MKEVDILELLPQQRPFVMVERLLHFDPVVTKTALTIAADNIFVRDGVLSEYGLVENIAQTCAVRMGYIHKILSNERIKRGFIGAIKNLRIKLLPFVGDTVETTISVVSEVMAMTLVEAKAECRGVELASCEMKIAISDI